MSELLPTCVLCGAGFVPGSEEHILPNATGWELATRGFVCPDCNAATAQFDATLVAALEVLVNLADPAGRRATAPSVSAGSKTFKTIRLDAGGKPSIPKIMPMHGADGSI